MGSSNGGGGTQTRDPSSGLLRSRMPDGQKGRGKMPGGALTLGVSPAGSRQPEAPPIIDAERSGGRPGGGKIPPQASQWGWLKSSS